MKVTCRLSLPVGETTSATKGFHGLCLTRCNTNPIFDTFVMRLKAGTKIRLLWLGNGGAKVWDGTNMNHISQEIPRE